MGKQVKKIDTTTEMVRIRKTVKDLVAKEVEGSRQSIGGFFEMAAEKELSKINKNK